MFILGLNVLSKEFEWECFFVLFKVVVLVEINIGFCEWDLYVFGCKVINGFKLIFFSKV